MVTAQLLIYVTRKQRPSPSHTSNTCLLKLRNCEDIEEALMHLKNRQGADSFDIFRFLALLNTMNRRPKCN